MKSKYSKLLSEIKKEYVKDNIPNYIQHYFRRLIGLINNYAYYLQQDKYQILYVLNANRHMNAINFYINLPKLNKHIIIFKTMDEVYKLTDTLPHGTKYIMPGFLVNPRIYIKGIRDAK